MKVFQHSLKYFLVIAVAASVSFTIGCKDDEDNTALLALALAPTVIEDGGTLAGERSGAVVVAEDATITVTGLVRFPAGSSLTVKAGAKLVCDAGVADTTVIVIDRRARINVLGTAAKPVIFTSSNATSEGGPGASSSDWGGIVIHGRAATSEGADVEDEYGLGKYGGTVEADNSGTIQYAMLNFGGKIYSSTNELNQLSLHGVGSGTTIRNVLVHRGSDDGFEMFGGSVDLKYVVASGNEDDQIDCVGGWRGRVQFAVAIPLDGSGDIGLEFSGNDDDATATPLANIRMANVSVFQANPTKQTVHLKTGNVLQCINSYFVDVDTSDNSMQIDHDETDVTIAYSVIHVGATEGDSFATTTGTPTLDTTDNVTYGDATTGFSGDADNLTELETNGYAALEMAADLGTATNPQTYFAADAAFFDVTDYVGAIENGAGASSWASWMLFPAD